MPSANHPPSPSPPPNPPPIATTPGPLATRLSELYALSLSQVIRTCSYSNFSTCFPTPATNTPEVLRSVWAQVTGRIEERAKAEFESICEERDVVGGLNELERLVAEARARRAREGGGEGKGQSRIPPHSLPPETLYLAHLTPYLNVAQRELEGKLVDTRTKNEELVKGIEAGRGEVERLVEGLERVIADLEGANELMGQVIDDGELGKEVMEVERESGLEL